MTETAPRPTPGQRSPGPLPVTPPTVPGPFPLGAFVEYGGVRFAVHAPDAQRVELCLFDEDGGAERRVDLPDREFGCWHGWIRGLGAGQRYGYRVHGPWEPEAGRWFDPAKVLMDPFARRVTGAVRDPLAALASSRGVDTAGLVPLSVVAPEPGFDTGPAPRVPWERTVLYEMHVRGFTRSHPALDPAQRGSYLGLAHPTVLEELTDLGVTSVELLPVQAFCDEPLLLRSARHNYWGYSPLAPLAVHPGYASVPGAEIEEFATMVAAMHASGLEVVLDVVFNHTCEGDAAGTTLAYRGLDARGYYLGTDLTGCGNTLDPASPAVVRLVTDALRYWAGELGVDGFRFDLASVLGRPNGGRFDPRAPLLTAIATDPVLSRCKLIVEPWDATREGFQVGGFGAQFAEWNGHYRDTVRDFWRGVPGVSRLASRLAGSQDLFAAGGRRPWAAVNFITAHDGFTLRDLVSYNRKHNERNGENGRDGTDDNRSWNCGVEGDTTDPEVLALRDRQARNLLATLLLSTGTPMLLAGDERWNTQQGNNNPYCIDDETTWLDWRGSDRGLVSFTRRLLTLRQDTPALRQPEFFEGRETPSGTPDLVWFRPDGAVMSQSDWDEPRLTLGMWIDGSDVRAPPDETPDPSSWLVVLHADADPVELALPGPEYGVSYQPVLDTGTSDGSPADNTALPSGAVVTVPGRTVLVLRTAR